VKTSCKRHGRVITDKNHSDAEFCRAKIATTSSYAEHILPQADGLAREVVGGAASVLALAEAQF
jgi:hypothetical protein